MLIKYKDVNRFAKEIDGFVKNIKIFLSLLQETVIDYYKLTSFAEINSFISNRDNILSTCTAIIFRDLHFYNLLINYLSFYFKEK